MSEDDRKGTDAAAQDDPDNRLASRALGQLAWRGMETLPQSSATHQSHSIQAK